MNINEFLKKMVDYKIPQQCIKIKDVATRLCLDACVMDLQNEGI